MKISCFVFICVLLSSCIDHKGSFIEKGSIELNNANNEISVSVGKQLYFNIKEHQSVGYKSKVQIQDTSVLALERSIFKYKNPPKRGLVPAGGDRGIRTYYFRAKSQGVSSVQIQSMFHGEKESATKYTIEVR